MAQNQRRPDINDVGSGFWNFPSTNSGEPRKRAGSGLPPNAEKCPVENQASTTRTTPSATAAASE